MATFNGTEGNDGLSGTDSADTINGAGGNDFLAGNDGDDSIVGGAGNDTIYGDAGSDWIEGGSGNDLLSGSGGQDSLVFREFGAANADTVQNFSPDWDKIQLDAAAFANLGAAGRFTSGDVRFYAAPGANGGHDADDRVVYNTSTGQLFYHAGGIDTLIFDSASSVSMPSGIENLELHGGPFFGSDVFGNALNNVIRVTSTSGPNYIYGEDGNDTLVGGPSFDTFIFGNLGSGFY